MDVEDIDDVDDAPLPSPTSMAMAPPATMYVASPLPLAAASAQPFQAPDPDVELAQPAHMPEPELELTPAASAAELEEQVAELMLRDRKGALNMVRAVLRRCTPAEFEEVDAKSLETEAKRLQQEAQRLGREAEKNAKRLARLAEEEARRQQKAADVEARKAQREEALDQQTEETRLAGREAAPEARPAPPPPPLPEPAASLQPHVVWQPAALCIRAAALRTGGGSHLYPAYRPPYQVARLQAVAPISLGCMPYVTQAAALCTPGWRHRASVSNS